MTGEKHRTWLRSRRGDGGGAWAARGMGGGGIFLNLTPEQYAKLR